MAKPGSGGIGPEGEVGELLRSLPRERCPNIDFDAIVDRWRARRRRATVAAAGGLLLGLGLGLLLTSSEPDAPVHLELRLVDERTLEAVDTAPEPPSDWRLVLYGRSPEVQAP